MKIFVAGATGAIGKRLLPILVKAGHQVIGTTRMVAKPTRFAQLATKAVVPSFYAIKLDIIWRCLDPS